MSELYHFGVKGMHWGVRRYQNEDGTYNEAGKKRYFGNAVKTAGKAVLAVGAGVTIGKLGGKAAAKSIAKYGLMPARKTANSTTTKKHISSIKEAVEKTTRLEKDISTQASKLERKAVEKRIVASPRYQNNIKPADRFRTTSNGKTYSTRRIKNYKADPTSKIVRSGTQKVKTYYKEQQDLYNQNLDLLNEWMKRARY